MSTLSPSTASSTATDPLLLIDVDHVRFYVGNAKQAAFFYASAFGFQVEQIADLTTGSRDRAMYLLTQGNIRIILESSLTKDGAAAKESAQYGDGVKDLALTVFDAEKAWKQAIKNGGESAYEPTTYSDDMPGFRMVKDYPLNDYNHKNPCGLKYVDHAVGNVELGKMNTWVKWYEEVLGFAMFKHFDDKDIGTEYSSLMSKVMASGNHLIKMPINEPAAGKKKSQIQEYLDWHDNTAGVQHLALRTDDELTSITELRRRGVDFLTIPETYYETVWKRVNAMLTQHGHTVVKEDHTRVKDLGILVDADDEGYLLQLFTKPLQDRPTLFFEIICRRGSQSFGKGNFKALFESLEVEQDRRGNL